MIPTELSEVSSFYQEVAVNILANFVSSVILLIVGFVAGRWWDYSRKGRAFKRVFGKRAGREDELMIVLDTLRDTRILPASDQAAIGIQSPPPTPAGARYYKLFPDRHFTWIPGPNEGLVPECSARAAGYLIDALRGIRKISTNTISDTFVGNRWNGTFIALGSSYSNIKTDDIKHLPENPWLLDDAGEFALRDGNVVRIETRYDKGLILKLPNPHCYGHSLIICEGLGEWGTSGAAWFLATHWMTLSKRFGQRPFLLILNITTGNDESAREILARGQELRFWRLVKWFQAKLSRE